MKNKILYIMGLCIFLLSIIFAIIPTFIGATLLFPYWFCIIHYFVSGLLYFIGIHKLIYQLNVRGWTNIVSGFYLGLIVWPCLIIITTYSIFWNQISLERQNFFTILGFSILNLIDKSLIDYEILLIDFSIIITYRERFILGFNGSVIHLILVIIGCILGIIALVKIKPISLKLQPETKKYYQKFHELTKDQIAIKIDYEKNLPKKKKTSIIYNLIILFSIFIIMSYLQIFIEDKPIDSEFIVRIVLISLLPLYFLILNFISLKPPLRKISPKIIETTEIIRENAKQELINVGIIPNGQILAIIDNIAYSDSEYAKNPYRAWAWQEVGILVLTSKELIFIGKKSHFLISISEINVIQPFITLGRRNSSCKVCEVNYSDQNLQAIFMGVIGIFYCPNPMIELELKSMKLLEYLQNWHNSWRNK